MQLKLTRFVSDFVYGLVSIGFRFIVGVCRYGDTLPQRVLVRPRLPHLDVFVQWSSMAFQDQVYQLSQSAARCAPVTSTHWLRLRTPLFVTPDIMTIFFVEGR